MNILLIGVDKHFSSFFIIFHFLTILHHVQGRSFPSSWLYLFSCFRTIPISTWSCKKSVLNFANTLSAQEHHFFRNDLTRLDHNTLHYTSNIKLGTLFTQRGRVDDNKNSCLFSPDLTTMWHDNVRLFFLLVGRCADGTWGNSCTLLTKWNSHFFYVMYCTMYIYAVFIQFTTICSIDIYYCWCVLITIIESSFFGLVIGVHTHTFW